MTRWDKFLFGLVLLIVLAAFAGSFYVNNKVSNLEPKIQDPNCEEEHLYHQCKEGTD